MISHVPLSSSGTKNVLIVVRRLWCGKEVTKCEDVERIDMVEIEIGCKSFQKSHQVSGNISDPRLNFIFKTEPPLWLTEDRKYDVFTRFFGLVGPAVSLFEKVL